MCLAPDQAPDQDEHLVTLIRAAEAAGGGSPKLSAAQLSAEQAP